MKAVPVTSLLILCVCLALTCSSDKPSGPVGPDSAPRASDFIYFDYATIQQWHMPVGHYYEPWVFWEELIGEPFTDINGNGIYDPGIDGFVRSLDSTMNQDLNYNGMHDGRENMSRDQWEPGIPFDDLDGDGTMRLSNDMRLHDSNTAFAPFADLNGNGIWDSTYNFFETFQYWEHHEFEGVTYINARSKDTMYYFQSDSGFIYYVGLLPWYPSPAFVITPGQYICQWDDWSYPLLDTGRIDPGQSTTIIATDLHAVARRHIRLNDSLRIGDSLYAGLLSIRIDSMKREYSPQPSDSLMFLEFYFSRERGLIACHKWSGNSGVPLEQSFVRTVDSLPLPMKKNPRPH